MTDFYSWVGGLSAEAIVAILSAAFAGLSYLFNLRLVRRQSRMQAANLKLAHDTDIIAWFHETVETLADAQEVLREAGRAYDVTEAWAKRSHTRTRISALMDRGRLFFPNDLDREDQDDREEGIQGPYSASPARAVQILSHRVGLDPAGEPGSGQSC